MPSYLCVRCKKKGVVTGKYCTRCEIKVLNIDPDSIKQVNRARIKKSLCMITAHCLFDDSDSLWKVVKARMDREGRNSDSFYDVELFLKEIVGSQC